jgi:beta-carotene hydroxylase
MTILYGPSSARLPRFSEISEGLTRISRLRLACSLALPFMWITLYFAFAALGYWVLAVPCLIALSFVTYGSISHDLVHGNLGLSTRMNNVMLSMIELFALRSGHAYRLAHLHHHARFPHEDDIEGAAAGMTLTRALLEGLFFQYRIWTWAIGHTSSERKLIAIEGLGCILIVAFSIAMLPWTSVFFCYVVLMVMGSWVIPLVTSYLPHSREGADELHQTRRFRGKMASLVAVEHLYHLEHHLYPAVPHHHWPELARRLDPYFEAAGITPVKFWF